MLPAGRLCCRRPMAVPPAAAVAVLDFPGCHRLLLLLLVPLKGWPLVVALKQPAHWEKGWLARRRH